MPHELKNINWSAPWLAFWRERGEPIAQRILAGESAPDALNAEQAAPVRFVPQGDLPSGMAYEAFIFDTHQVPTREGLHDFFNALCWMEFPRTKKWLNQLQAAQIAQLGVAAERGAVRDAITLFDENAALLQAPDALWNALVAKDWHAVFHTHRDLWQQSQIILFGHALMEKLVQPRKNITAHVYRVEQLSDKWLAADLTAEKLAAKPFAHLPVLGVPNWSVENDNPDFYADTSVFRAPRGNQPDTKPQTLVLGGGCFWCTEAVFTEVRGVLDVESGYSNGHTRNPTYEQVCAGDTGHNEVVKLVYDPAHISTRELLEIFFVIHDPTTLNRQGNDCGTQYRSGIYCTDAAQESEARALIAELEASQAYGKPIVTEVVPLANYSAAEDYHQDFFARNPYQGYCRAVAAPKVIKFRETFARLRKAAP